MLRSVRLGFATNSSSSHSVILHPDAQAAAKFSLPGPWSLDARTNKDTVYDYDLGAQADKLGMVGYFFARILEGVYGDPGIAAHERLQIHAVFARHGVVLDSKAMDKNVYMDRAHLEPPKGVPLSLWLDFLLDPRVTLHGAHEYVEEPTFYDALLVPGTDQVPANYDNTLVKVDGDALVFFDSFDGTKIRWSKTPYLKSSTPELVDVKITDHCTFGCAFCYQGSTPQGQHASLERVTAIFDQLAAMGVFEIALGGGEPLAHPDFGAIMEAGIRRGLSMAFTTFDPTFPDHPELHRLYKLQHQKDVPTSGNLSAIGVSVHNAQGIERLKVAKERMREREIYASVVAQSVVGATPMATTERLVHTAIAENLPLLLLGYKTTGRGAGRERPADRDAVARILRLARKGAIEAGGSRDHGFRLGVDTAFLDRYGDLLDDLRIPGLLRTSPEGKFSMYVDAVANTCGPSSYCGADQMEPVGDLHAQFAAY